MKGLKNVQQPSVNQKLIQINKVQKNKDLENIFIKN